MCRPWLAPLTQVPNGQSWYSWTWGTRNPRTWEIQNPRAWERGMDNPRTKEIRNPRTREERWIHGPERNRQYSSVYNLDRATSPPRHSKPATSVIESNRACVISQFDVPWPRWWSSQAWLSRATNINPSATGFFHFPWTKRPDLTASSTQVCMRMLSWAVSRYPVAGLYVNVPYCAIRPKMPFLLLSSVLTAGLTFKVDLILSIIMSKSRTTLSPVNGSCSDCFNVCSRNALKQFTHSAWNSMILGEPCPNSNSFTVRFDLRWSCFASAMMDIMLAWPGL